jgi:hypothetical protein
MPEEVRRDVRHLLTERRGEGEKRLLKQKKKISLKKRNKKGLKKRKKKKIKN